MQPEPSKKRLILIRAGWLAALLVLLLLIGSGAWLLDFAGQVLPTPPTFRIDPKPTPPEPSLGLLSLQAAFMAHRPAEQEMTELLAPDISYSSGWQLASQSGQLADRRRRAGRW